MAEIQKKVLELTAEEKAEREAIKLLFEVYKHLTTLSSGSIVIICTFLEKFFKKAETLPVIIGSLLCFLFSILLSIYVMSRLAMQQKVGYVNSRSVSVLFRGLEFLSSFAFILGVLLFAIFSILNLYKPR